MSVAPQLLIETDVLADYLTTPTEGASPLRQALRESVCYTTMLNALELFRAARTPTERAAVLQVLHVVRILGFNARFAEPFADLAHEIDRTESVTLTDRETMIAGMARASKLTILTRSFYERYRRMKIVAVQDALALATPPLQRNPMFT